jgi:hypothetical protein
MVNVDEALYIRARKLLSRHANGRWEPWMIPVLSRVVNDQGCGASGRSGGFDHTGHEDPRRLNPENSESLYTTLDCQTESSKLDTMKAVENWCPIIGQAQHPTVGKH